MVSVTVEQGKLKGAETVTQNGNKIYQFLSIPYAKPPIGDLRFKNPQPPESWENERDATVSKFENTSWQFNLMTQQFTGSEDCLYLNVLTPKLPPLESKLLPVIFSIHGGGFVMGNGIMTDFTSPEFLVEKDVVVVTINYRLGVFGFLSLDIPEVSGNMGLKDQVKALKWVQKNIAKFGGDKDNVTIFGSSAGAASVEYLMLSHTTRGLFHKAIPLSGSAINDWASALDYNVLASKLADHLGYNGSKEDKHALGDFFRTIPAESLAKAAAYVTDQMPGKNIYFGFVPTVEKIEIGAFLTTDPYKKLKDGKFVKVPVLRGFCNAEGALAKPPAVKELIDNKNFASYWPYKHEIRDKKKFNSIFYEAYSNAASDNDLAEQFFGDFHFIAGVWVTSILFARHGITEYVYKFSYDGKLNCIKNMFGKQVKGATHGDDMGYLFDIRFGKQETPDNADLLLRSKMTKMWTNFAKTGNPTPNGSEDIGIEWPKFTESDKAHLNIDKEITVVIDHEPKRMAIFQEIYNKYEK